MPSSVLTLFLPLLIPPYTNGYAWARVPGLERHHGGLGEGEEVFFSDDGEDDELDDATEIVDDQADGPGAVFGIVRDGDEREPAAMVSVECRQNFKQRMALKSRQWSMVIT